MVFKAIGLVQMTRTGPLVLTGTGPLVQPGVTLRQRAVGSNCKSAAHGLPDEVYDVVIRGETNWHLVFVVGGSVASAIQQQFVD